MTKLHSATKVLAYTGESQGSVLNTEDNLSSYLRVPLKAAFVLCCCPFLIVNTLDKIHDSHFSTKRILPQLALCGTFTLVDILWMMQLIRNDIPSEKTTNPAVYIIFLKTLIIQSAQATFLWKLWFESKSLLNLVNFIVNGRLLSLRLRWYNGRLAIVTLLFLYCGIALWNTSDLLIPRETEHNQSIWWSGMVDAGRKMFYFDTISYSKNCTFLISNYSEFHAVLFGTAAIIGKTHR